MWTLVKLAFRNIFRFKRRTFITFSAVSVGLALLVISITLMNGVDKQSISNIINCRTSHIKIFKQGYFDKRDELPMSLTIADADAVKKLVKSIPNVTGVESRVLFGASLIKGTDELPCLGVALEPAVDPSMFNTKQSLVEGEWLTEGDEKMLIGRNLARDIGLKVGDQVTVRMISSTEGESFSWNAVDLVIKGIFDSGDPTVDSSRVMVPMGIADDGLGMEGQVTEVVVRLNSEEDEVVQAAQAAITKVLTGHDETLEVHTWKDLAGMFLMISEMKTNRQAMIIMIMLLIASLGIINTMLMAVLERTREIGMMSAMGMKSSEITLLFVLEGGFIGMIGSFLGCLLGGLTAWYLEVYGWSMSFMGETMQKISQSIYPVKDVFYADLTPGILIITFVFGTLVAILAGLYPARKAAKLNPVDALRHI